MKEMTHTHIYSKGVPVMLLLVLLALLVWRLPNSEAVSASLSPRVWQAARHSGSASLFVFVLELVGPRCVGAMYYTPHIHTNTNHTYLSITPGGATGATSDRASEAAKSSSC